MKVNIEMHVLSQDATLMYQSYLRLKPLAIKHKTPTLKYVSVLLLP